MEKSELNYYPITYSGQYEDDEAFTEMATVLSDSKRQFRIQVNPDRKRKGDPYFKVFDTATPKEGKSRVARLHFKDSKMGYHDDGYRDWIIVSKDIRFIHSILKEFHEDFPKYNNWQIACYLWNYEYGFDIKREEYFKGLFDDKYKDHPSYVPSNIKIPDSWIYDPPKNKNKRKFHDE